MAEIGFAQYVDLFKENEIDGEALRVLSPDNFKELVPVLGHRAKLLIARDALFGKSA